MDQTHNPAEVQDLGLIEIFVAHEGGENNKIEVPTGINLSLMEVLKASEYPIQATCGGMALCATCHIEVLNGDLHEKVTDQELDILDTLPNATGCSRLACQVPVNEEVNGVVIRLMAYESE